MEARPMIETPIHADEVKGLVQQMADFAAEEER